VPIWAWILASLAAFSVLTAIVAWVTDDIDPADVVGRPLR
jgi:hypothetical protein